MCHRETNHYLCKKNMAELVFVNNIPCTVVGHYGDYIHYCRIDNDTPGEGMVQDHMLVYVYSGELDVVVDGKRRHLHKGQAFLLRRNHRCRKVLRPLDGEGFEGVFIHFKHSFLKKTMSVYNLTPRGATSFLSRSPFVDLPQHPLVVNLCESIRDCFRESRFPSESLIQVKLAESILTLLEIKPEIKPLLFDFTGPMKKDLMDFMEENYLQDLSLKEMSQYTGRSLTAFKKEFSLLGGISPRRWVTRRRLQEARRRMEELGESPLIASENAGFKGYSHFSQAFKKEYGISPSEINKIDKS